MTATLMLMQSSQTRPGSSKYIKRATTTSFCHHQIRGYTALNYGGSIQLVIKIHKRTEKLGQRVGEPDLTTDISAADKMRFEREASGLP